MDKGCIEKNRAAKSFLDVVKDGAAESIPLRKYTNVVAHTCVTH